MSFSFMGIIATLAVAVMFIGILCVVQFFLSRTENKYFGMIIPFVSFVLSLIVGIGRLIYDYQVSFIYILGDVMTFVFMNIPTAFFLLIYFKCRKSKTKKEEINKMNIRDL